MAWQGVAGRGRASDSHRYIFSIYIDITFARLGRRKVRPATRPVTLTRPVRPPAPPTSKQTNKQHKKHA